MSAITSIASGVWSAVSTWDSGTVPTATDDVICAAGFTVTYGLNDITNIVANTVTVNGVLAMDTTKDTGYIIQRYNKCFSC